MLYLICRNGTMVPMSLKQLRNQYAFPLTVYCERTGERHTVVGFRNGQYLCTDGARLDAEESAWTRVA